MFRYFFFISTFVFLPPVLGAVSFTTLKTTTLVELLQSSKNRDERLDLLNELAGRGAELLPYVPEIKASLAGAGEEQWQAASELMRGLRDPHLDEGELYRIDFQNDLEAEYLLGPVRQVRHFQQHHRSATKVVDYNEQGYIKHIQGFTENGLENGEIRYTHFNDGRPLTAESFDRSGKLFSRQIWIYDEEERLKERSLEDFEGSTLWREYYQWDERDRLTERLRYPESGNALDVETVQLKYNKKSLVSQHLRFTSPMAVVWRSDLTYDAKGNTKTRRVYAANLPLGQTRSFSADSSRPEARVAFLYEWRFKFNKKGNKKNERLYWGNKLMEERANFKWDKYRQLIRERRFGQRQKRLVTLDAKYAGWGLLEYRQIVDGRNGDFINESYTYDFDHRGNWTRRDGMINSAAGALPTQRRKIEYWD